MKTKAQLIWQTWNREAMFDLDIDRSVKRYNRMMRLPKAELESIYTEVLAFTCECGDCDNCDDRRAYRKDYAEVRSVRY